MSGIVTEARPLRVLTVGPAPAAPHSRGGMATVVQLMVADPDPRVAIRSVATYVDASLPRRTWTAMSGVVVSAWLLLTGRTDVLHVHLSHGGSVVRKALPLLIARLCGVPTFVHGHSANFVGWMETLPRPAHRLVRTALVADHYLVLGQSLALDYQRYLGIDGAKIHVLYNPVPIPRVLAQQSDRQCVNVVSLGRLGERKGTYDLIEAVALLPEAVRSRIAMTVAGDGDVDQIRTKVHSLGLGDTVAVPGWIGPDVRDSLLREAAIFVLPSYEEGLPMALLEAMAHGVVPVTTPVGAIAEVVVDGVNGMIVTPGDSAAIASALSSLVIDQDLRATLAQAARARAADFDITGWHRTLREMWAHSAGLTESTEMLDQRTG